MTRRSITAVLGSLLVALLLVVNAPAVSAGGSCSTGYAPEHCAQRAVASDATLFSAGVALVSVHILSASGMGQEQFEALAAASDTALFWAPAVHILGGSGMGQEQFEAMEDTGAIFLVAGSSSASAHMDSGYAPENYEQMLATFASN
jgi:hypothetical protein